MFAIIFFRLWYLQVLSGDKYLAQANNNRVRDDHGAGAARRDPRPQRQGPGRQPHQPRAPDHARRSSRRSATSAATSSRGWATSTSMLAAPDRRRRSASRPGLPPSPGDPAARRRLRPRLLPAREPGPVPGRHGPARLRAPLPGRQPRGAHLRQRRRGHRAAAQGAPLQGLQPGDQVGQVGVEYTYDRYLRGSDGQTRVQVDALGRPTRPARARSRRSPATTCGSRIDSGVQAAGEAGARRRFGTAGRLRRDERPATARSSALGSAPTLRPARSSPSRSPSPSTSSSPPDRPTRRSRTARSRASIPTGSTFKPITAIAALSSGT